MRAGLVLGVLLAGLAAVFVPLAAQGQSSGGKRYAVLIANQNYPGGAKWGKLDTPHNDATQLAKVLKERYGFVVQPLVKDARREEIVAAVYRLRQLVSDVDSVLIFYAGHGQLDEANDRGYWIPIDGELYDPSRWLSVSDITDQVKAIRARHVIVIADACYSGTLVRGGRSGLLGSAQERIAYLRRMAEKKARTAMVSGGIELVADGGGGGHSVFVRALLDALRENREVIDGFELFQRIRQAVIANAEQTPQYADIRFAGHDGGDFLFAPRGARLGEPVPASVAHDPVQLVFWQSAERGGTVGSYEAYLGQYPDGVFAALARERIAALQASQVAAVVMPPPSPPAAAEPVLVPVERAYTVTVAKANLREAPSLSAKVVGSLSAGEEVHVLARVQDQDWLLLERGGRRLGYMAAGLLEEAEGRRRRLAEEEETRKKVAAATPPPAPPAVPSTRPSPAVGLPPPAVPTPGERFRDCAECPEMVWLPAGRFTMGSPESETSAEGMPDEFAKREQPQREVRLGYALAVGVHEVTRGEYAAFAQSTGRSEGGSCFTNEDGKWEDRAGRGWRSPGFSQDDRHPVVCVNWDEATAYADWLSGQTGKRYRLLSEAEWEYAARAGTTSARWWGSSANAACGNANVHDRTSKARNAGFTWQHHECDDGFAQTAPVGSFNANGFGLRDILGNVWEWVGDCWNDTYAGAPSDGSARTSGDCGRRGLRGGSWYVEPRSVRAAIRSWVVSGSRIDVIGFRVARTH